MSRYGRFAHDALKNNQLTPKKRFGQNFLVHRETAEAIVRAGKVTASDTIVEVGVGLGALTLPLAAAANHVYGYEIDSGIVRFHEQQKDLPENVTLIHQDILKADFNEIVQKCGAGLKILANLPYSISNPFIFKLIDNAHLIKSATIMLQKEVADRLSAEVNTKDYGVPTILLASVATVDRKLTLKPAEFHPRPKVDSVVITIDFTGGPKQTGPYDYTLFKHIVRSTFNQRRKTVINTLSRANLFGVTHKEDKKTNKELAHRALTDAGIAPSARPETLLFSDFVRLAVCVEKLQKEAK
ncbi:16S rRNA (adenine(1518)-N(6)/adenine(1519)-N(6))-dimethyltransferase RsmA [Desulforhopalus singaporensis]|uniref:Ribosomal RNA small subunit methyltransferase A n=1 Tax=Desulforhopalus singaporensis TaxID=91360 RepID=A0A1H0QL07_9BACT|nr:16S rRNA (adenine(1518)-N(6)/adenine(1519)-N(6))-dimethyltransferase RsmA [Desulforhopalus singaporensis]SDP17997.1 dimethyladenosine transferase [Desulforhopalus singaporensis]